MKNIGEALAGFLIKVYVSGKGWSADNLAELSSPSSLQTQLWPQPNHFMSP